MTNDIKISRDLAKKVDDLLYIITGHDGYVRLVHKYGANWWNPINEMRAEICTLLAAPVVERQDPVPYREFDAMRRLAEDSCNALISQAIRHKEQIDKLYTSPPAPVAVVLPIEADFYLEVFKLYGFGPDKLCMLDGKDLKRLWLACIDKVKELNQ